VQECGFTYRISARAATLPIDGGGAIVGSTENTGASGLNQTQAPARHRRLLFVRLGRRAPKSIFKVVLEQGLDRETVQRRGYHFVGHPAANRQDHYRQQGSKLFAFQVRANAGAILSPDDRAGQQQSSQHNIDWLGSHGLQKRDVGGNENDLKLHSDQSRGHLSFYLPSGRLQRFLPRRSSLDELEDGEIEKINRTYNQTPRKYPDFKTPNEVFIEILNRVAIETWFNRVASEGAAGRDMTDMMSVEPSHTSLDVARASRLSCRLGL